MEHQISIYSGSGGFIARCVCGWQSHTTDEGSAANAGNNHIENLKTGDSECRICHNRGFIVDEFVNPMTGLCSDCTDFLKTIVDEFVNPMTGLCSDCTDFLKTIVDEFVNPMTGLCSDCTDFLKTVTNNAIPSPTAPSPIPTSDDPINPSHYRGDDVMCIIERYGLDFLDGQVIKYILRSGRKPGNSGLQDHEKAAWYLNRKITNLKKDT